MPHSIAGGNGELAYAGINLTAGFSPTAYGAASSKIRGLFGGAAESVAQTGAREILNPRSLAGWDAAEGTYDAIRTSSTDIMSIAQNIGMPEWRIARVKDHLFFKERQLDVGLKRFDADPDIVNAWSRLNAGDHVGSDVSLLRHEIFESKFEGIFKTNYRAAHDAAIRSGRPWVPGE